MIHIFGGVPLFENLEVDEVRLGVSCSHRESHLLSTSQVNTIRRTNAGAKCVLSLGAKVNNNKCRVSAVYTKNWGGRDYK